MEAVSVPKKSVKSRVTPALSKQAIEIFERRFAAVRAKLNKANDVDASNVENVRKLSRYLSLYVQLNVKKATNETKRESENVLRKAFDTVKRAESEGDFQGQKLVGNSRFTEKGAGRFATKAMKYLMKVYDRVDSAEVREDGTYDNSVFSVPEEGTASQLDAPVQPAPAPAPAQPAPRTQTAEQTRATLAGEGAGDFPTATATVDFTPLDPHAQAKTDGTAAGGSSNDAGEDDDDEHKPTVRPGSVDDGYDSLAEDDVGDTSTATGLKTGDGTTNPIGASADGAGMRSLPTQEDLQEEAEFQMGQARASIQEAIDKPDFSPPVEGRQGATKRGAETEAVGDEHGQDKDPRRDPTAMAQIRAEIDAKNQAFQASLEAKVQGILDRFDRNVQAEEDADAEAERQRMNPDVAAAMNRAEAEDARTGGAEGRARRERDNRRFQEGVLARQRAIFEQGLRAAAARVQRQADQRAAEARAQAGQGIPVNIANLFDGVNQRAQEAFNQEIQGAGGRILNAVERQAFIASMEQGEREDAREEYRQAQVPAETQKQAEAMQRQQDAEAREQANAPPLIPGPVDVDIDIASLSLGDAGSVPSTQQVGDAMTQDKAKESMERKHRESLSVQQLKQEIEALHSVYDSLIPEFKKPEHQRQKQSAMASGRPEALREHLSNMMASVRRYYTQGGMRVGVIISREAFMGMQGGQAGGMSAPATSQQKGIEITKHGQSKFRPQVKNEQVMRGGINTKKTLDNFIPKVDPQSRRPQRPYAQLTRFDHPHPSVALPRRTQPYDLVLKTKKR